MTKNNIDPEHYKSGDIYEHRKVVVAWGLGYELGCATKYICRAGKKKEASVSDMEKEIEDLRKAIRYIEFRIEVLNKEIIEKGNEPEDKLDTKKENQ